MKYQAITFVLLLPLSGCFMAQKSTTVPSKSTYDASTQARIRLYGPYGNALIKPHAATSCEQWEANAGKRKHHKVNNGLPRKIRNITTGIAPTQHSTSTENDKGIMFRDSYKEYVVRANLPLVLDAGASVNMSSFSSACRVAHSFVPQAGQDYEASFVQTDGRCSIVIKHILPKAPDSTIAETQDVTDVQGCKRPRSDAL